MRGRRIALRVVACLLLLAVLAGYVVTTTAGAALLMWGLEKQSAPVRADRLAGRVDAIAVLGGRTARIHHAAKLHRATGLPILITGKGSGDSGFAAESEKMEDILLRQYGVGPRWVETDSRDTHQNAVFSWCLVSGMGVRRLALVTDPAHMARARAEFAAVGFRIVPAPTTDNPRPSWRPRFAGAIDDFIPGKAGWAAARRPFLEWGGAVLAFLSGLLPGPSCP